MPDHSAALTELLGLVDERFQAALHAGIARLATSQVTPSPHQRAEAIMATSPRPNCENEEWWVNQITTAIQEASNDTLERGRKRTAEVQAALQAALEDLAKANSALTSEQIAHGKTMRERDEFALALQYRCPVCDGSGAVETYDPSEDMPVQEECAQCSPARRHLAAHDRAVAARVLRKEAREWRAAGGIEHMAFAAECLDVAKEYEAGEREVPGE